jgi:hypothetical protein
MRSDEAIRLAQQVVARSDNYPTPVVQAAIMLLLNPDSKDTETAFVETYQQASTVKSILVGEGLSYPPDEQAYYEPGEIGKPGIEIGVEPIGAWVLRLFPEELRRHVLVIGATGTGKTNLLRVLAKGIVDLGRHSSAPPSVIIFDRHGNFAGLQDWLVLDAREGRFGLLEKVTEGFCRLVLNLTGENRGLIKSVNVLEDAQERIERALRGIGERPVATLSQLVGALKSLDFQNTKHEFVLSARTEIEGMLRSIGPIFDWASSDMMQKVLSPGTHIVLRTGSLDVREELYVLTWLLLYAIETGNAQPRHHHTY